MTKIVHAAAAMNLPCSGVKMNLYHTPKEDRLSTINQLKQNKSQETHEEAQREIQAQIESLAKLWDMPQVLTSTSTQKGEEE